MKKPLIQFIETAQRNGKATNFENIKNYGIILGGFREFREKNIFQVNTPLFLENAPTKSKIKSKLRKVKGKSLGYNSQAFTFL